MGLGLWVVVRVRVSGHGQGWGWGLWSVVSGQWSRLPWPRRGRPRGSIGPPCPAAGRMNPGCGRGGTRTWLGACAAGRRGACFWRRFRRSRSRSARRGLIAGDQGMRPARRRCHSRRRRRRRAAAIRRRRRRRCRRCRRRRRRSQSRGRRLIGAGLRLRKWLGAGFGLWCATMAIGFYTGLRRRAPPASPPLPAGLTPASPARARTCSPPGRAPNVYPSKAVAPRSIAARLPRAPSTRTAAPVGCPRMARSRCRRARLVSCKLCSWSRSPARLPGRGRAQRRRTIEPPPHCSVQPRSAVAPPQLTPSLPHLSGASCSQWATCSRRWRALGRAQQQTRAGGNKQQQSAEI